MTASRTVQRFSLGRSGLRVAFRIEGDPARLVLDADRDLDELAAGDLAALARQRTKILWSLRGRVADETELPHLQPLRRRGRQQPQPGDRHEQ